MDGGVDYGTDPRGFVGWENQTKTVFFVGILTMSAVRAYNLSFAFHWLHF